jgi:hypothetical protein
VSLSPYAFSRAGVHCASDEKVDMCMMGVKLAPYARTHPHTHAQALFRRAQARVSSKDFEASLPRASTTRIYAHTRIYIPDILPHRSF